MNSTELETLEFYIELTESQSNTINELSDIIKNLNREVSHLRNMLNISEIKE